MANDVVKTSNGDGDWTEQEPRILTRVSFEKVPWADHLAAQVAQLAIQVAALTERLAQMTTGGQDLTQIVARLDAIEATIAGVGTQAVTSFNGRFNIVSFNQGDLTGVGGATQTWVLDQLDTITIPDMDGGVF